MSALMAGSLIALGIAGFAILLALALVRAAAREDAIAEAVQTALDREAGE